MTEIVVVILWCIIITISSIHIIITNQSIFNFICTCSVYLLCYYNCKKEQTSYMTYIFVVTSSSTIVTISVGIQTATLWISYGHPACNKRAGFLFELHFTITLTVIWIYRTVTYPKNWMCSKSLWEFLLLFQVFCHISRYSVFSVFLSAFLS